MKTYVPFFDPFDMTKTIPREERREDGVLHREDGPALVWKGLQAWYLNGVLHREDGPAIMDPENGYYAWFNHGKKLKVNFGSGRSFITDTE